MNVAVILNSGARAFAGANCAAEIEKVRQAFKDREVQARIACGAGDEVPGILAACLQDRARNGDCDAVVVGGGDGTVGAAAAQLAGTDVPLGILPLGTLNHFARDLGLPGNLEDAVKIIAARQCRRIDLGEVNGKVFVNNSSVGLYPVLVSYRNAYQRRFGLGKLAATAPALFKTLLSSPWRSLRIAADGKVEARRTPLLFIGNNLYSTEAFSFGARKALDGAELCVYVIKNQNRFGLISLPLQAALGRLDHANAFELLRVASIEIASRAKVLRVAVDGEVVKMRTPLRYRTRPGALKVFGPLLAEPERDPLAR